MTDYYESHYPTAKHYKEILKCQGVTDRGLCNKVLAYANKEGQLKASVKCPRCGKVNER